MASNQLFSIDIKIEPNCGKYLLSLHNNKRQGALPQDVVTQMIQSFSHDAEQKWRNSIMELISSYNDRCKEFVLSELFEPHESMSMVRYSDKEEPGHAIHAVEDPSFRRTVVSVRQKRDRLMLTENQGIELIRVMKEMSTKSNELFFTIVAMFDIYPSCQFYFNSGRMYFANRSFVGVNLDTARAARAIQFVNHINANLQ